MVLRQETKTILLEKPTYGGECFGRLGDGRAVFVPFTLPGEVVRVRLVEEKRGFARGDVVEILEPSPKRIDPRCPHFTVCGGCHYQHMACKTQQQIKVDVLEDQLQRIGKIDDPPVAPLIPSPASWYYRNNIQFHLTPGGRLGFQSRRGESVVPVDECHLPEETLGQIWPLLDMEAIPGLDRIGLRVGAGSEVILTLESSDPQPVELVVGLPISVVHNGPGGSLVLAGSDHISVEVAGRTFRVSGGSFFQVNTPMAGKMVAHILEGLHFPPGSVAIDAYCGVGLFSAFLAPHVERLIAIEASPSACEDFVVNLDEFDNVELYEAPTRDVLNHIELAVDILIADPPRSGMDRDTLDAVKRLRPATLVYVSCDPATFARDAQRLIQGGFKLQKVTPFDLFPQTYHIETISFWSR